MTASNEIIKERKKVASNTFFYLAYQCILFIIPLIIMPYLTRVLSESVLGEYSFSYSIAYYFVLGANLGISLYGQREIASNKDDKEVLARKFWSLFYVHSFFSLLSFGAYILFFTLSHQVSLYVFIIPYVISALFDVTWFFYGLENFKLVTIVNACLSIVKMALIFIFVKSDQSLWAYQLISFGTVMLSQLIILGFAVKQLGKPIKVTKKECLSHFKPIMYFALAAIALTLYTYVDKTLLGVMVDDAKKSVAYYECADKIVAVPRMLITVLGTVLYPKMCSLTAKSKNERIKDYTYFSIDWTGFLSFGAILGLVALALPFSLLYYGESYATSGYCMMMMSPLILVISTGSICRTQYILPQKKDKIFLTAISINAIINLTLNVAFIPSLGVYGVILSSLISETVALIYQLHYCKKFFPFKYAFKAMGVYLFASIFMFMIIYGVMKMIPIDSWVKLLILILVGVVSYSLTIPVLSSCVGHSSIINKLKREH